MFKLTIEAADLADLEHKWEEAGQYLFGVSTPKPAAAPEETPAAAPPPPPPAPVAPVAAPPPAPVAPVAPVAAPPAAAAPAAQAEVDIEGVPWDERIHASSRAKLKSGQWRAKRGVDAQFAAGVRAEILAARGAQPAAPVAAPPVAAPPAAGAVDVQSTIVLASKLLAASQTPEMYTDISVRINAVMDAHGLESAVDIVKRPDLAPVVTDALRKIATELGVEC
jgi:2-oxoglutarate dehydrogenase E2 component (dihydrolipoamide succinyltransferase)